MTRLSDIDYMLQCIECNLSYKAYLELCQKERRIYVDEVTYNECAHDYFIRD